MAEYSVKLFYFAGMIFICRHFSQLSLEQLYALIALRQEVFVVEQNCPYLDADGKDSDCHHLMGFDDSGTMVTYARLVPKELSYTDYVSIGRVITAQKIRGQGMGQVLMKEAIQRCRQLFDNAAIKVSAQCHLQKFYNSLGFEAVGESYLEDDIPHIGMIRPAI